MGISGQPLALGPSQPGSWLSYQLTGSFLESTGGSVLARSEAKAQSPRSTSCSCAVPNDTTEARQRGVRNLQDRFDHLSVARKCRHVSPIGMCRTVTTSAARAEQARGNAQIYAGTGSERQDERHVVRNAKAALRRFPCIRTAVTTLRSPHGNAAIRNNTYGLPSL
jgi:hypothetical protein